MLELFSERMTHFSSYYLGVLLNSNQNLYCSWRNSRNRVKIHFAQLFVWTFKQNIIHSNKFKTNTKKKDANIVLEYYAKYLNSLCKYFFSFFFFLLGLFSCVIISNHIRDTSINNCKVFPGIMYAKNLNGMLQCTVGPFLLRDTFYST